MNEHNQRQLAHSGNAMTWHIIEGDCIAVMPTIQAGYFDAVIADPPYGTTDCAWDSIIPLDAMWRCLARLVKPGAPIVLFASQPFTSALVMSRPSWYKHQWVWNKNNSAGFLTVKHRPFAVTEDILVFGVGGATVNYYPQMEYGLRRQKGFAGGPSQVYGGKYKTGPMPTKGEVDNLYHPKNLINISKINKDEADHPTQKPVALMRYLVETYTKPGGRVLDFCAGVGSTGVACMQTGRDFIGIEQDAAYAARARERIGSAPRQHSMWDGIEAWNG